MALDKRRDFIINTGYFLLIIAIVYVVIKYLLGLVAPFLIGFLVALVLQRFIGFLADKLRFPRKLAAVLSILLFYLIIGLLLILLGMSAYAGVKDLVEKMPRLYSTDIEPALARFFEYIEGIMIRFDLDLAQILEDIHVQVSQSIGNLVSEVSSRAIGAITSTVTWVPKLFFGIVLSIISSVFFAMDFEKVTEFFTNLLPHDRRGIVSELRTLTSGFGGKYIKAYALLLFITFIEVSIGLSILGVERAVTIGAITAIVDIMPVLGTGLILIPWAIFKLIQGNLFLGFGLFGLYIIITVIRNVLEPKLVGQQIGLHPIVMLLCMYVGVRLFGVVGLFALPISVLVLKYLYEQGKLLNQDV